eukprot:CAMPEP_0177675896 /NCGR_PEP_ID=MMETSP0447-20121125/27465_1 /TAXON_ID=0 /ORGANISM="Stygamoeba regulata, Strain BSH-02190019" /LENGTH=215 /DNA_ID=CAMNT_0019184353 /DNA_START=56 /DNA_END=703 /DNA_ORIENTATION=-
MYKFLLAVCLLCTLAHVNGLHMKFSENDRKCFMEELPKDTLVVAKFTAELIDPETGLQFAQHQYTAVKAYVLDPNGNHFTSRSNEGDGKVAFTSSIGGEYKICFQADSSSWFSAREMIFSLTIETGADAIDYSEVAKLEDLNDLELKIRRLNDRVRAIRKEQSYQKYREMAARNTSESTNSRVMWWSVFETVALVGSSLWQLNYLKRFFRQKKLV